MQVKKKKLIINKATLYAYIGKNIKSIRLRAILKIVQ